MLLGVLFGVVFLVFSKRNQGEKSLLLIRDAVLPDTADADAIFRYMEEVCSHDKLSIDELCSTGRDYDDDDDELDLFMKYSADKMSIPIDKTLTFDEFLTALSKDIADSYENSNVAKYYYYDEYDTDTISDDDKLIDYELMKNVVSLKKGRYPTNDYEVIINYNLKDEYKLNKKIDYEVNGTKLKVVGYYTSNKDIQKYLVSNTTMKYFLITNSSNITIYPKDKTQVLDEFRSKKVNIQDSYDYSRNKYIEERKDSIRSSLIACTIVLIISLIEIYLMIRSSFLSRIREVGIYRAIGVKKLDIYKMFTGEIIAITTLSSLIGVIFMSYIINQLSFISYMRSKFMMNTSIFILTTIFVYLFNLIVGLLPVYKTIRKTPAQIMSRSDI